MQSWTRLSAWNCWKKIANQNILWRQRARRFLSAKQRARSPDFRIDFAGNGLAVAAVERHCARRTTGGRRESGNQGTEFFSQFVETIIPMSYPGAQKLADHLKVGNAEEQVRVIELAAGSEI